MTDTDPRCCCRQFGQRLCPIHQSILGTVRDVLAVGALATTAGALYVVSLVLVALAGCGGEARNISASEEPFGWCCDDFCGLSARDSEYFTECTCAGIETGGDGVGRGECIEPLTE